MVYNLSQRSLDNMRDVHADLQQVVMAAIKRTTQDFGVTGKAVRTAAEQNALFRKGVTQKDGYKNRSNHQAHADGRGHAVDLTPFVNGKFDPDTWENYYPVAAAMSEAAKRLGIRITWGGNWYECMNDYGSTVADMKAAVARYKRNHPGPDFIDGPHFQLEGA